MYCGCSTSFGSVSYPLYAGHDSQSQQRSLRSPLMRRAKHSQYLKIHLGYLTWSTRTTWVPDWLMLSHQYNGDLRCYPPKGPRVRSDINVVPCPAVRQSSLMDPKISESPFHSKNAQRTFPTVCDIGISLRRQPIGYQRQAVALVLFII